MRTFKLDLTPDQIADLKLVLKTHPKPYMRERASAILQIQRGKTGTQVAHSGLLSKRRENTIYAWVHRYQQGGLAALGLQKGRGRKTAYSPPQPTASPIGT